MTLERKRWLVLVASCIINLCIGSFYAWSVFATPMVKHLNLKMGLAADQELMAARLVIVFAVANFLAPIMMIAANKFNDVLGIKGSIAIGSCLFAGGFFFGSYANSLAMLILSCGASCGLGMGLIYGATSNNLTKLFPDKVTLIEGILTIAYGLSSVFIPPMAYSVIEQQGVEETFRMLGTGLFVMILICTAFLVEARRDFIPSNMVINKMTLDTSASINKTWRQMLKDSSFYIMILMLMCGCFSGLMIISQAQSIVQNMVGLTMKEASHSVSVLAFFNVLGRVLAGYALKRIRRVQMIQVINLVTVFGMLLLAITGEGSAFLLEVGFAVIGLCFGLIMRIYPRFTLENFGSKYNNINYRVMLLGFSFSGIFAPLIAAKVVLSTGSYQISFVVAGGFALFGFALTYVYAKLKELDRYHSVNHKR